MRGRKKHIPKALGGGCRPDIIEQLAWHSSLTVNEIRSPLRLSYMGVKSQCIALEKAGYIKAVARRRERGRPEVVYSLTPKGRRLLPSISLQVVESLLDQSIKLFGSQAPEKILFLYFEDQKNRYLELLGPLEGADRVARFVELRSEEGRYASILPGDILREGHWPLAPLVKRFACLSDLELSCLREVLGSRQIDLLPSPAGEAHYQLPHGIIGEASPEPPAPNGESPSDKTPGPAEPQKLPAQKELPDSAPAGPMDLPPESDPPDMAKPDAPERPDHNTARDIASDPKTEPPPEDGQLSLF